MDDSGLRDNLSTKEKLFLGYIDLANCVTILSVGLALSSCYFALTGALRTSVTLLILSGICDLFDGAIARKIKRTDIEKTFGAQLDTVADVVSFGVTPAVIVFSIAGAVWYTLAASVFYIICAVIRLAYFNTTAVFDKLSHYNGLPVTYMALILPVVLLFKSGIAGVTALVVVGLLFILNIKIPKPRGVWYAFFPVIAAVLIALWWLV